MKVPQELINNRNNQNIGGKHIFKEQQRPVINVFRNESSGGINK